MLEMQQPQHLRILDTTFSAALFRSHCPKTICTQTTTMSSNGPPQQLQFACCNTPRRQAIFHLYTHYSASFEWKCEHIIACIALMFTVLYNEIARCKHILQCLQHCSHRTSPAFWTLIEDSLPFICGAQLHGVVLQPKVATLGACLIHLQNQ